MTRRGDGLLHVFVGTFDSREDACRHTERQWEPEPDNGVSDEEYEAWEDRNPTWEMRDELAVDLESEFIETIDGYRRYHYLGEYLQTQDMETVRKQAANANTLVLIFPDALQDRNVKLRSTSKLIYCGAFEFVWP